MQSHELEWRDVPLDEFNDWIVNGWDMKQPFPFETWVDSVDGMPMAEVDNKTRLKLLPEVYDFLSGVRDSWIKFGIQRSSAAGNNSSTPDSSTTQDSTET